MKHITIALLIVFSTNVFAQSIGLKIGDNMPDVRIPKIFNYKKSSVQLSELSKDLLIVDFWSRGCKSCIEALPKMERLQEKFKNQLFILPVTYEKESDIRIFWKKNPYTKDLKGPSVVEDTIFRKLFKHIAIPHEVWIYKGKVIGITALDYIDQYNVEKVLAGEYEKLEWPIKNDFYSYDRSQPVVQVKSNGFGEFTNLSYVAISPFKNGINSPIYSTGGAGIDRDTTKRTIRTYFLNQSILTSYLVHYGSLYPVSDLVTPFLGWYPNQVIWKVKDKTKYTFVPGVGKYYMNWIAKHGVCFESLHPDTGQTEKQIHATAINDLNGLLGLDVRWVKRNETVWVVKRSSGFKKYEAKIGEKKDDMYTIYQVINTMNEQESNPYIFNESQDESTFIKLPNVSWTDIGTIKKALADKGFNMQKESRVVDKFLFEEKHFKKDRS